MDISAAYASLKDCRDEVGKRIVGQTRMIDSMLMAIVAGGHILLEGVPGLAKTLAVKTLAEVLDLQFRRLQFTPDLLPADLIGSMVYKKETGEFVPRKGPVFSQVILADEINRAPAKVQAALLEAMEEQQVTLGENSYALSDPFFVLATQNPIEHEGTYPLPEAQLDRFLLKVELDYPSDQEELAILRRLGDRPEIAVNTLLNGKQLKAIRSLVPSVKMDFRIEEYIVQLVLSSRVNGQEKNRTAIAVRGKTGTEVDSAILSYIEYGASPRATISIYRCAKVQALMEGRDFVIPEDVKAVAPDVLRHRIILNYEAESENLRTQDIITRILGSIKVP